MQVLFDSEIDTPLLETRSGGGLVGGFVGMVLCPACFPNAGIPRAHRREIKHIRPRARRLTQGPAVFLQCLERIRRGRIHIETVLGQVGLTGLDQLADWIVSLKHCRHAGFHGCAGVADGGSGRRRHAQAVRAGFEIEINAGCVILQGLCMGQADSENQGGDEDQAGRVFHMSIPSSDGRPVRHL